MYLFFHALTLGLFLLKGSLEIFGLCGEKCSLINPFLLFYFALLFVIWIYSSLVGLLRGKNSFYIQGEKIKNDIRDEPIRFIFTSFLILGALTYGLTKIIPAFLSYF